MKTIKYILFLLVLFTLAISAQQDSNLSNLYRLGKTFEQSGDYEKAKEIYQQILELQPWNTMYLESLNEMYVRLREYDKSIKLLEEKIKESPANINLYGILGNTYYTKGDTSQAYQAWEAGLNSSNNKIVSYRVIVNYALQNRAFEKAIQYLKEAEEISGSKEAFAIDLARVYSMTMNFEKAAKEFCKIIVDDPVKLQMVIGIMNQYLNRPSAIEQTIESVLEFSENIESAIVYELLIHLYKLNGDFENAFEYVERLEQQQNLEGKEYFKFAREALNEDKFDIASKSYEKVVKEYPNSSLVPPSRIGYAKTFEKSLDEKRTELISGWKPISKPEVVLKKEYNEVIDSYEKIIELYPNTDIRFEAYHSIGNIYYQKLNSIDTARTYFKKLTDLKILTQYHASANLKLAEIQIKSDSLASAEKLLNNLVNGPGLAEDLRSAGNLLLGKLHFWQGNYKLSMENLSKVTDNLFDDNANDALNLLTIVGTLSKDSSNLALYAKADLLTFQNEFDSAASEFKNLMENQNMIISEIARLKYAQTLAAQNLYTEALDILNETSKLEMFAADFEYLRGEIKYFALKDYPGAIEAYRNILENYSNSLYFDKSRQKIETIKEMEDKSI